jgi:glyoxylase-like metal-dependent hydrolase (beta-lactamase superfamily II)
MVQAPPGRSNAMQKPVADFWYAIDYCDNRIIRLREAWIDPYFAGNLWLIKGSERDLLIDTGTGIISPRRVVEAITDKPIIAVACNCLYDHAGGLHAFDQRGCHRLDADNIAMPTMESSQVSVYVSNDMLLALPSTGYDTTNYRMAGAPPTSRFDDGDSIDLGDRCFEVLHMPGETPGTMVLWESATGSVFTSDTLYDDPLAERGAEAAADPDGYAASLQRLRALPVRTVYPGHYRPFGRDRMLQVIDHLAGTTHSES